MKTPVTLPPALEGDLFTIDGPRTLRIQAYARRPAGRDATPLVLVHSVNAAASAYEVRPLFDEYGTRRPTYALDLPGFGLSDRSDRPYSPRLMTDAVRALIDEVRAKHGGRPVDALALSLSCEFLARAASEAPDALRKIALISPTGFAGSTALTGTEGSTRGSSLVNTVVRAPLLDDLLFDNLTRPRMIRFFLEKTWGRRAIDDGLFRYDVLTTRAPGAKHAPLWFVSGHLFSADIDRVYDALELPVWMAHGVRGDFTDYRKSERMKGRANWRLETFDTGAIPWFERREEFVRGLDAFLES